MDLTFAEVFGESAGAPPGAQPEIERPSVQRPVVYAALAYIAGLAAGRIIVAPWQLLAFAALACVAWSAWELKAAAGRGENSGFTRGLLLLAALAFAGWMRMNGALAEDERARGLALAAAEPAIVRVEGRVAEPPLVSRHSMQLVLDDVRIGAAPWGERRMLFPRKVVAWVRLDETEQADAARAPRHGARAVAWGRIVVPPRRTNPADMDRALVMASRGAGAGLAVASPRDIERARGDETWREALFGRIQAAKEWMIANLVAGLGARDGSMAAALLLGERGDLTDEMQDAFARTGLAHILSVSGLHTGFVLAFALLAARLAGLSPRPSVLAASALLLAYAALTGFRPPVMRAAIMAWFLAAAWSLGRMTSTVAALAASALVTLALDPRNLMRVDWQLSHLCVASIALLGPPIFALGARDASEAERERNEHRAREKWRARAARWIGAPLAVSLAIHMGLFPLHVALFHSYHLLSVAANMIAVPAAFGIVVGVIPLALLGWAGPAAALIGAPLGLLIRFFEGFVELTAGATFAELYLPSPPVWAAAVYYGALLAGPHLLRGRGPWGQPDRAQRRHMAARVAAFALFVCWFPLLARTGTSGALEVTALDVGQGDAIVFRTPGGRVGVIDGGMKLPGSDQGRTTIAPYLRAMPTKRIDYLIATHADDDHVGGLAYLARNFKVGMFLHGPDRSDSEAYADLERAVAERRIPRREIKAGDRLPDLGGAEAIALGPAPGLDNNDASIVLMLKKGEVEILLTGDIEAAAEEMLLASGAARDVEVLKVAHHGSRTSTSEAFLQAFKPEIALVSAGRRNRFGHPAPDVIDRMEARGTQVARTDQLGSLKIRTDGRYVSLLHFGEGTEE